MTRYKALTGDSGVTAYAIGRDSIIIEFRDASAYLYNYDTTGVEEVETMKQLATEGRGLATFINKHVKERYAAKLVRPSPWAIPFDQI